MSVGVIVCCRNAPFSRPSHCAQHHSISQREQTGAITRGLCGDGCGDAAQFVPSSAVLAEQSLRVGRERVERHLFSS